MRQRFQLSMVLALTLAVPAGAQTFKELFDQAAAAYEKNDWPRCADLFSSAAKAATQDRQAARAFFAAAACSAAAGQKDSAFGFLDKATARGHDDLDRATNNPQVQALHDDPRWKAFFQGVETRHAMREKSNPEIKKIHDEDQADRIGGYDKIDWTVVGKRDVERRARLSQILAEGGAKIADDYFHAALVFQHGATDDEIAKAHELALKAIDLDSEHPNARWLAAASKDRLCCGDSSMRTGSTVSTSRPWRRSTPAT